MERGASGFLAPKGLKGLLLAGSANGAIPLRQCLSEGAQAAINALAEIGVRAKVPMFGPVEGDGTPGRTRALWRIPGSKAFVDFQYDVTAEDIRLALREGYRHVELAKRYTTNGWRQIRARLRTLTRSEFLKERGVSPGEVGGTTFRPFYTPVSFGALAGASIGPHFQPLRRSPMHEWAEKNGAQFVETGLWIRSSLFPWAGETHWRQSVDREARTVRETAGLCDVSTPGKIEIFGADAGAFLNRVYCNGFANLPVGKARYRLMLREDGGIVNLSERRAAVAPDSLIGLVSAHVHFSVAAELPEAVRQFRRGLY